MTGDSRFVESIGTSRQLIYIPIAGLIISTLRFSIAELGLFKNLVVLYRERDISEKEKVDKL